MALQERMLKLAIASQKNAYAPYSNFKVGACILTDDNKLFAGCNIENAAYQLTLCAEASALSQMICHGYQKVFAITIISSAGQACPPCGSCRQRLFEFSTPETLVYLYDAKGELQKTLSINELLPYPFDKTILRSI